MTARRTAAVVLAAGQGTRMRSTLPKPLHPVCGRPLVAWAVDAAAGAGPERVVVVVGHGAERVRAGTGPTAVPLSFAVQEEQKGTGDAAAAALACLPEGAVDVVVLPGDAPLLRPETVAGMLAEHRGTQAAATMLTVRMADPHGYGRVVRDAGGAVVRVVEEKDATPAEKAVDEVCTSIYCFRGEVLADALGRLSPENAQGEYYLTDVIGILTGAGRPVATFEVLDATEPAGVNDRVQLAQAERVMRRRINEAHMRAGVTMVDPDATYVAPTVSLGRDVTLLPGTFLAGATVVGDGSTVGPCAVLTDCQVAAGVVVPPGSWNGVTLTGPGDGRPAPDVGR
ncbi:MAG TPA: NTP transferase domain-containing protein [Acidimicrobiales bacterium]|nr:NTP transferase domain-containing protein [Acidimicrobiales bacterium]